jgi:hypothetical protein
MSLKSPVGGASLTSTKLPGVVAARMGSNPALGLTASQPQKQNCADDNDKENNQFHCVSPYLNSLASHPSTISRRRQRSEPSDKSTVALNRW